MIATGESHSVQDVVEVAFGAAGLDWRKYVKHDPELHRPSEVNLLLGDAAKACRVIGWPPRTKFRVRILEMLSNDCRIPGVKDVSIATAAS